MERAYGTLEVRSVDDEARIIEGIANSASEDSHGTVIDPSGAIYRLPIPLFFHEGGNHGPGTSRAPIGNVIATEMRNGLRWFRAQLPKIPDDGTEGGRDVKRHVDSAWTAIKHGLVRGTSIEFLPVEPRTNYAKKWSKWDWRGLAVVPVPSNRDATILSVRSAFGAASGASTSPGVSGDSTHNPRQKVKTTQEQIQDHSNSRAAKVARKEELMTRAADEGRTLDETESQEFDTLDTEIRSIDDHLVRLNTLARDVAARATPVVANTQANASQTRSGVPIVSVRPHVEPGITMARHVMALAACNGNKHEAAEYAKRTWGDSADELYNGLRYGLVTRSAVAAGTTLDSTFAAPLVQTNYATELLDLLRPATLIGRIPGLRRVPFNTSIPAQTAGATPKWVGQGKMKPVGNAQYSAVTLGFAKASVIIVLTEELVKLSTPSAEALVRDTLVKDISQFLDGQFVDSSVAAVSNVNPASITNGVVGTAATGTDVADARSDISARIGAYAAANYGLDGLVILMSQSQAFSLGSMVNSVGAPAFPGLGVGGGTILGVPAVASETVGSQIIFAHAPSILVADDGPVDIAVSREASIDMQDTPTEPSDASTVLTSMFQANMVAIRAERFITWGKARSTAVDRITSAAYTA